MSLKKMSLCVMLILFAFVLLATGCAKKMPPEQAVEKPAPPSPAVRVPPPPPPPPAAPKPSIKPKALSPEELLSLASRELRPIYFDYDKSEIKPEAREILNQNAAFLREHPNIDLLVEGHCDERGTNEYNLALGQRRADRAMEFLINLGIEPSRIITKSWGEERPADLGHDESAWRWNRRAEFVPSIK